MSKRIVIIMACMMILCVSCNVQDGKSVETPMPTAATTRTNKYGLEPITTENSIDGLVHGDAEISKVITDKYAFVEKETEYDPFGFYKSSSRPSAYDVVVVPTADDAAQIADKILLTLQEEGYYANVYPCSSAELAPNNAWGHVFYWEEYDLWTVHYYHYFAAVEDMPWMGSSLNIAIARKTGEVVLIWHGET